MISNKLQPQIKIEQAMAIINALVNCTPTPYGYPDGGGGLGGR